MKTTGITNALVRKMLVLDAIYQEWKHEGYIDIEHTDNFRCVINGRLYEITVREIGEGGGGR